MNRITTGMDYSEEAINTTYQRFSGNRAFNSVNLQLTQVDTTTVDCNIRLTGSKLQGMRLNLEASVNASALIGISPSISYTHKNLFHGGEYFTLGFRGNFQFMAKQPIRSNEFAVNASISLPKFLLLPSRLFNGPRVPTTDISASFNYQSRPEYKRQMISGSYGYSWSSSNNLRWQVLPVQLNIVRMNDVDTAFFNHLGSTYLQNLYTNHFDLGAGVITYYSTSQETNPDYTYFYLRFQGDISGNLLSLLARKRKEETGQKTIWGIPYSQYVRAEISAVQTWRFGKDDKFALAGRLLAGVGYAYGNSKIMPLEKSFFAGGASSLRGWQTRTVGPGNAPIDKNFAIANQTGEMRLEANLEFRFPIVGGFGGAVFVDAGNVWNLPKKGITPDLGTFSFASFGKSIAMDWGLGARYDFGMILVRVDLGVKGYDPVTLQWLTPDLWKERGWKGMCALHFGVGYPF
ncbi:MAG: BamA/TamA family outer membrane protein [Bacteroidales bacterium]|nr:BamA/TamA family outer membrane protein [Bacteroidales bacterium]